MLAGKPEQTVLIQIKGNGYTFKRENPVKIVFAPPEKRVYPKRKEIASVGNSFFFLVDPFSEGTRRAGKQARSRSHKDCLPYIQWQKNLPSVSSLLKDQHYLSLYNIKQSACIVTRKYNA